LNNSSCEEPAYASFGTRYDCAVLMVAATTTTIPDMITLQYGGRR
jgi:hypothetical protein